MPSWRLQDSIRQVGQVDAGVQPEEADSSCWSRAAPQKTSWPPLMRASCRSGMYLCGRARWAARWIAGWRNPLFHAVSRKALEGVQAADGVVRA